jgi:hypothetical protein
LHLLRLEFEIFRIYESSMHLVRLGKVASRDLVIGDTIDAARDSGLACYCEVLELKSYHRLADWKALEKQGKWVKIHFGSFDQEGTNRNQFEMIEHFDKKLYTVSSKRFELTEKWFKVSHAAELLDVSVQTVRRKADKWEKAGHPDVVRRTAGNQREINLPLLWDLEEGE